MFLAKGSCGINEALNRIEIWIETVKHEFAIMFCSASGQLKNLAAMHGLLLDYVNALLEEGARYFNSISSNHG
ncbi:hypothetical protein AEQU_0071 [Adlercreutzia equolifaciens DSM 19450]|nr:hypothetical protein HMPREF9404_4982 [Eggerthella sp. HGA1]BAN76040.1 hypothetical protein AEQU_0071 [Adlercreutzia equolifaciens DSM 19450]